MLQSDIAKGIATRAHEGQVRKMGADKGKPYIIHPERIAKKFYFDDHLCAAAWLHDTLEDTDITEQNLLDEGIHPGIIELVKVVTKTKNESYLNFILRIKNSFEATALKIADINDNMMSLQEGSLKDKYRMALYILEHRCE
jgi:(p)ppGpp synthase/HD superfamily hydrolase